MSWAGTCSAAVGGMSIHAPEKDAQNHPSPGGHPWGETYSHPKFESSLPPEGCPLSQPSCCVLARLRHICHSYRDPTPGQQQRTGSSSVRPNHPIAGGQCSSALHSDVQTQGNSHFKLFQQFIPQEKCITRKTTSVCCSCGAGSGKRFMALPKYLGFCSLCVSISLLITL